MVLKRVLIICSIILSMILLYPDFIIAQLNPIYRFKDIYIPVSLEIKNKILEKGAYDLDFCRTSSPVFYFVRIMKRGKILDILQGEEFPYGIAKDRNIPYKPTLKMTRYQSEKLLILVFESGIRDKKILVFAMARGLSRLSWKTILSYTKKLYS